jgi:SOUL heme-binding protein
MASLLGRINEGTPKFDLLKKAAPGHEIRRYHRQLRASVTFDDTTSEGAMSQQGFRQLAGYIFGGSKKRAVNDKNENESIAMIAPVMTETNILPGNGNKKAMTMPI